jgi:hypothetical protein
LTVLFRPLLWLALAANLLSMERSLAQAPFPAPLPDTAQKVDPVLPPANGAPSPFPSAGAPPFAFGSGGSQHSWSQPGGTFDDCMKNFIPLREEAESRGKLIKAASERHAPPDEACKLIGNFEQAERNMIEYVESHAPGCAIPAQVADQLKNGHESTARLLTKVCLVADRTRQGLTASVRPGSHPPGTREIGRRRDRQVISIPSNEATVGRPIVNALESRISHL